MQPGTAQGNRSDARRELDDSLAIRLPADIVEALGLKEGDAVELRIAGLRTVAIARAIAGERRDAALARIKESATNSATGRKFWLYPQSQYDLAVVERGS